MSILDSLAEKTAAWLTLKPRQATAVLVVTVVVGVLSLGRLQSAAGLSVFIADNDTSREFMREVEKAFVSDNIIYVAYQTDDAFSHDSLAEVRGLTEKFQAIDGTLVEEVVSLATIDDVSGADMTFRTVPLVPDEIPTDTAGLEAIHTRALRNPLIRNGLLSKESRGAAAMLVRLQDGVTDEQQTRAVHAVREILAAHTTKTHFMLTGQPVGQVDTIEYMQVDLSRFIPITYLLMLGLMYVFTRRIAGVLLAFINATVAIIVGMATVAWLSSLNNLSTIMPPMLMVLSVATVVHFLTEYARNTHHHGPEQAARMTMRELLVPAFLCELTTAVGFASFVPSRIPVMREFGIAAGIGVMAAFATSFLVLAAAVRWYGADRLISSRGIATSERVERGVSRYTELAIRRPKTMLAGVALMTVFSVIGLKWLKVDHDNIGQFSKQTPFRQATDFVNDHLGGSGEYVVSIRTHTPNRFMSPAELAKIEALEAFLEREAHVASTSSVADYVKVMNRGFNDDVDSAFQLPATQEQIAQLVLLNGDDRLFQLVDRDWSWARLSARTQDSGSSLVSDRVDLIEAYLAREFPASAGYEARVTGNTRMAMVMATSILDGQIISFALSLLLIFVPIGLAFGSWTAAAYTIPSNIFPILACFGVMGWIGMPLDLATSMTTAIILGIAVDDTIHFVQTMRTRFAEGDTLEDALRFTMATKGVGALWITIIVTVGFAALVASSFSPTSNFGLLTAFAMLAGVAAEMFLLPPLMVVMQTRLGVAEKAAEPQPLPAPMEPVNADA